MEIMLTTVELPLWLIVALPLFGTTVGMFFLILAIMLLGRGSEAKGAWAREASAKKDKADKEDKTEKEVAVATVKQKHTVINAPEPVSKPVVAATELRKPIPPIRHLYWYYVSDVSGRFATLREALLASGVRVVGSRALDWEKLSPDTRAKIRRVKVDGEQPVVESVDQSEAPVPREKRTIGEADAGSADADRVVKRPIGGGAFVTYKKKAG